MQSPDLTAAVRDLGLDATQSADLLFSAESKFWATRAEIRNFVLGRLMPDLAGLMHLALLRYRDVHVGNAETGGRPGPRFAAMAMAAPSAEPGEATAVADSKNR